MVAPGPSESTAELDFRKIFESLPGLYLILLPDLRIVAASDNYLKATMTIRENIVGKDIFEVFPDNPDDNNATGTSNLRASLERVIRNKTTDVMAIQKYDVRGADGEFEEKYWSPLNSPVLGEKSRLLYIIHNVVDVTDFVKLKEQSIRQRAENAQLRIDANEQEKISQSRRLESLGRLAGGIAHDFNTILMLIMARCEAVITRMVTEETPETHLAEILKASRQAADLIRQLMSFSRNQSLEIKPVNVNFLLREIEPLLTKAIPSNIRFEKDLAADLGQTPAATGQIEQILMNLTVNAVHAMPRGGVLTISTANVKLDNVTAQGNPRCEPGEYVKIAVSDTGVGMSAETQARIFEPFFTTKAIGKGTGLGLATVYGIVGQNKGTIWVYSRPGEGTRFEVYLPHTAEKPHEVKVETQQGDDFTGNETILIAEDTADLRRLFARIIKNNGYRVLEAADGSEALNIYRTHPAKIDLVITDGIMPNMTGLEMAGKIRKKNPAQKIIFLTGYSKDNLVDHDISSDRMIFLEKPVSLQTLLGSVRKLLDTP